MENKKTTSSKWIVVKESDIHGMGVYAAEDIPKGTEIIEYVGRKVTKEESDKIADRDMDAHEENGKENGAVYIFELNKEHDIDGNVEWNTARLINHSCDPNCETSGDDEHIWIEAKRDIKKGEELGYDYCYDIDDYEDHPCLCKSANCIGFIVDEKFRLDLKKKLKRKRLKNNRKVRVFSKS
jgi:uncharacterized protein